MDDRLVNVVVASPLHQEALELIKAVSRINLEQVSALIVAERKGDGAAGPQLDSILAQAEVLYGWIHHLPPRLVTRARNLKWLQVMSAGVRPVTERNPAKSGHCDQCQRDPCDAHQ